MSVRPSVLDPRAFACDVTVLRNFTSVWQEVDIAYAGLAESVELSALEIMVRSCCAIGCIARDVKETREAGVQFYRIPQKELSERCGSMLFGRKDWQPSVSTVICSQHLREVSVREVQML